ncbi:MAG: hypothetical protein EAZ43_07480 [Betaproteobacteria bacterium]|nr:MAG: hypothetical protein EAZ43_07480 [Betaproteobacteria bacterium]
MFSCEAYRKHDAAARDPASESFVLMNCGPLPFKGRVGVGMVFFRFASLQQKTIPLLASPLKGEGPHLVPRRDTDSRSIRDFVQIAGVRSVFEKQCGIVIT